VNVHKHAAGRIPVSRRSPQPCQVTRVDPRVLRLALNLAGDRPWLLRILSVRKVAILDARYSPPK